MSDESISYGEDKENLLYISKKINVDEFGLGEDGSFRESLSMAPSDVSVQPIGSELALLEGLHSIPQIFDDVHLSRRFKPFSLRWAYGISGTVGLINLSSSERQELFFASSHSPIVYEVASRTMRHLEAHQALINGLAADASGEWLVTCDGDKDGCLIVWSRQELEPVFTLFGVYPDSGVLLMGLSPCARYLVAVGESCGYYEARLWLWTLGDQRPHGSLQIHLSNGPPVKICFHPDCEEHIMLVFQKQVYLLVWDQAGEKLRLESIPHITNKTRVGTLTSATYMPSCHECFVASTKGCVLVLRSTLYKRRYEDGDLSNAKMYINAIKVTQAQIGTICCSDGLLVVGDARGHVMFFDRSVRILFWLRNLAIGPITALSFSGGAQTPQEFYICTSDCNIYFCELGAGACSPIFQVADASVSALDTHDELPRVVVGYANGRVTLMDYEKKEQIAGVVLPRGLAAGDAVTCLRFSPQSLHLACGRANGEVWLLEAVVLSPKTPTPFSCSDFAVEHLEFSGDALQFAYSDANRTVHLFNYDPQEDRWRVRGKVRAHYEAIGDLGFFPTTPQGSALLTLGADRHLVEYNNMETRGSEVAFGIASRERIEQSAIPTNFAYYEKKGAGASSSPVGYLLLGNDQHKIKILHAGTKLPRGLVLGPAFGCFHRAHIRKMRVVGRYLVFATERHLGIQLLPPDGNPFKHSGYLAHPQEVGDFAVSYDGACAFTFGVGDRSLLQWEVKPRAVELLSLLGGTELEPFYSLLEGGKSGWLFQEVQDLFFYMQILQQENIDLPRRVSDSIPLSEVPELVRTCGFYPTEFEMETMMMDIRYRDFDETGLVRDEVSFVEFVRLFLNHRPAYGYSLERVREAFGLMCQMAEYPKRRCIEREDFVYLLQAFGEPSSMLHRSLTTLLRVTTHGANNFDFLPAEIDASFLVEELLGIDTREASVERP